MDIQNTSTWQILIVDDEPDNLEVVAESLQFFGASVKIANNGEEGLKTLEEYMPSFILLDLSMPVMDGWEMRSRVKANPKTRHIPVIALSAHAMAGDKERAMNAGFDGYMTKPINIPTLLTDLREVFRNMKPVSSDAVASQPASSDAAASQPVGSDAATSQPVSSDAAASEPVGSDAASSVSPAANGSASTAASTDVVGGTNTPGTDTIGSTNSDTNISAEAGRTAS